MGLDMYLYLEDKETSEVIEYSYYRKFNALQGYFVEKFDIPNCGKVKLTEEIIEDVYQLLNEIRYNREKANLLLPTFPGHFLVLMIMEGFITHILIRQHLIFTMLNLLILISIICSTHRIGEIQKI